MKDGREAATPMRAHVVLPEDLLSDIDRVAGRRKRSRFVEAAVREKIAREAMALALKECAGAIDLAAHPEWKDTSDWVRGIRVEDDVRLARKLRT